MSDAILQRLWEIAGPLMLLARETRNARPSPLWRKRIDASFRS